MKVSAIQTVHDGLVAAGLSEPYKYGKDFAEAAGQFKSLVLEITKDSDKLVPQTDKKKVDAFNASVDLYDTIEKEEKKAEEAGAEAAEEPAAEEEEAAAEEPTAEEEAAEEEPAAEPEPAPAPRRVPGKAASAPAAAKPAAAKPQEREPVKTPAKGAKAAPKKAAPAAVKPKVGPTKAKAPAAAKETIALDAFGFRLGTKSHEFGKMIVRKNGVTAPEAMEKFKPFPQCYNVLKKLIEKGLVKKVDNAEGPASYVVTAKYKG